MRTTSLPPASSMVTSHTGARKLFVSLGLLLALLLSALPVAAQEVDEATPPAGTPEATPEAEAEPASVSNLMEVEFEEFPSTPMTVRLLRITLEPGASVPLHTHPGPELNYVESGTLNATADGEALVALGDGTDTTVGDGESIALDIGDAIVYPQGVGMAFTNEGEEPLEILSTVALPVEEDLETIVYTDGIPTDEDFEGVSFTVLGDGLVQDIPDGVTTVSIDSVSVPEGSPLPGTDGPTLYSLVEGDFGFTVEGGLVQVSRTANPSLQPNAISGENYELETGDAAIFPAGVSEAQRGPGEPLEFYRVLIIPSEELADSPATIMAASAAATVDDGTSGAQTDAPDDPQTAVTTEDGINLRAEPSVEADIVTEIAAGVDVGITGDEVDADDFTWLPIEIVGDEATAGWVATDFLDLVTTEPVTEETAAEAEDVAEEDAEDDPVEETTDFSEGDTVAVNDELVRIRADATIASNIVDAFPQGTQFTVTGEAVEDDAGEFVWVPVVLVGNDAVTGFIPTDFLSPSEPLDEDE